MANTSVGRQLASSEWLMGEVAAGSRGRAAGRRCCLAMGVVLLGSWVACSRQMVFVMMWDVVVGIATVTVNILKQEERGIEER
jgi:hypothetical protein